MYFNQKYKNHLFRNLFMKDTPCYYLSVDNSFLVISIYLSILINQERTKKFYYTLI